MLVEGKADVVFVEALIEHTGMRGIEVEGIGGDCAPGRGTGTMMSASGVEWFVVSNDTQACFFKRVREDPVVAEVTVDE